jgi:hypothetical protein
MNNRGCPLNRTILEISPFVVSKRGDSERILYDHIKTKGLTADTIRTLLLDKNVKKPNVIDDGDSFLFGYENHPLLIINKTNGRIYCKTDSITSRIDAIRLLRILNYYHLVEGFLRIQHHKRNQTVPFLEETRLEGKNSRTYSVSGSSCIQLYSFISSLKKKTGDE